MFFLFATGLAVKRVGVGLKRGFVVTGPGISEEAEPSDIDRLLVGKVIFRGGKNVAEPSSKDSISSAMFSSFRGGGFEPRVWPANFAIGIPDTRDNLRAP